MERAKVGSESENISGSSNIPLPKREISKPTFNLSQSDNLESKVDAEEKSGAGNFQQLQFELESLKDQLKLYVEPPNLDELTVAVNGFKTVKTNILGSTHVRYQITRASNSRKSLSVFRRFSDWLLLHSLLLHEHQNILIPSPPPKKRIGNTEKEFIEMRMLQLHAYTQALARHPTIKKSLYFRKFLYLTTEQWEEVSGSVIAVKNLAGESSFRTSSPILESQKELNPSLEQSSTMSRYIKRMGKTGMSLLSGLPLGLNSFTLTSPNDSIESISSQGQSFISAYNELCNVDVKHETYYAFVNNSFSASSGSFNRAATGPSGEEMKTAKRVKVYRKCADAFSSYISLVKDTGSCTLDMSASINNFLIANGSETETYSTNPLKRLSVCLSNVASVEDTVCHRMSGIDLQGKGSLINSIFETLYTLEGTKNFRNSTDKQDSTYDNGLIREMERCQIHASESLDRSLRDFVEQQISRSSEKVRLFTKIFDDLQSISI